MLILFTIGVLLYSLGVWIASLFGNEKAKLWVEGRRKQKPVDWLKSKLRRLSHPHAEPQEPDSDWIWFHAASLGEFEQGRPVIEAIRKQFPQFKILLTFFSPSGYEVRKDYAYADEVAYLPVDTPRNAARWVKSHHFVAAFFIKYDFWFNYMRALKKAGIPLFYISLILHEDDFFFKPYGKWFRKQLQTVTHFFVQDETTARLLHEHGLNDVTICGDTRFDRVADIAKQAKPFPEIEIVKARIAKCRRAISDGWSICCPMVIHKVGKEMYITDGQGRLEAAIAENEKRMTCGCELKYNEIPVLLIERDTIEEMRADIKRMNNHNTNWSVSDALHSEAVSEGGEKLERYEAIRKIQDELDLISDYIPRIIMFAGCGSSWNRPSPSIWSR